MLPSLSADLSLAADDLAPSLVGSAAQRRLLRAASALPSVHFAAALECRLSGDDPRVDLLLGIRSEDGGRDELIAVGDAPALANARSFCARWRSDPALAREVPFLWIEFDMLEQQHELGEPLAFVCLRSGFATGPLGSRRAESQRTRRTPEQSLTLVRSALGALAASMDGASERSLRRCFEHLPEGGDVLHVASMHPRGQARLRVVAQLPERQLCAYLAAIRFEGQLDRVAATLSDYFGYSSAICVDLDVSSGVEPVIGLELHYPGRDRRLVQVLDALVREGACTPDKRSALLAWPGSREARRTPSAWPTMFCREVGLKLVLRPDHALEAKAYLWFGHRFSLFA